MVWINFLLKYMAVLPIQQVNVPKQSNHVSAYILKRVIDARNALWWETDNDGIANAREP